MNSFDTTKESLPGFIIEVNPDLNATIEWVKWNMAVSELTEEQTTEVTEIFNTHSES